MQTHWPWAPARVAFIVPVALAAMVPFHDGAPGTPLTPVPARVQADAAFDAGRAVALVDARFVSFAVDTIQVVGGPFWAPMGEGEGLLGTRPVSRFSFTRPRLRRLAGALGPAYLRIGGTDADRTTYDLGDAPVSRPPGRAHGVLTRAIWDEVNDFARELDLRLLFTLNAGPTARDAAGDWDPAGARSLIAYSVAHGYPVDVWELGNEANAFPVAHGVWLSAERYAADLGRARRLLDELAPSARLAGPASSYWPVLGAWRSSFDAGVLDHAGGLLDVVSWHYYPQQSYRCPVATRSAHAGRMMTAVALADLDGWADEVESATRAHTDGAEVWLGETGSAQCGGEPGFSNAFADALWWSDTLGRVARRGQKVVVRQTLAGADYGLIDERTLEPNPSYWVSWLWRRLMGTRVLAAAGERSGAGVLHAYYQCARPGAPGYRPGAVSALFVNIAEETSVTVDLAKVSAAGAVAYRLTAPNLRARRTWLNGAPLTPLPDGTPPDLATLGTPVRAGAALELPAASLAFVVLPAAEAPACREDLVPGAPVREARRVHHAPRSSVAPVPPVQAAATLRVGSFGS